MGSLTTVSPLTFSLIDAEAQEAMKQIERGRKQGIPGCLLGMRIDRCYY